MECRSCNWYFKGYNFGHLNQDISFKILYQYWLTAQRIKPASKSVVR